MLIIKVILLCENSLKIEYNLWGHGMDCGQLITVETRAVDNILHDTNSEVKHTL